MGAQPASATASAAPVAGRAGYLVCLDYDAWAPEKVVDSLAGLGYRWCEWSTGHYALGDAQGLRRLKAITEAGGLGISELIAQQDYVTLSPATWEERVARTETAIRDAAAAGIGTVNVLSGPNLWEVGARRVPAEVPTAAAWELVWRAFDRIVPLAEREGIGLAFEACWGTLCDDYFTTADLLARYDSPAFGINLDPSHYVLRRQPIDWVIERWGDRIRHVHMKDVIGEPGFEGDTFMFPLIGEGRTDWGAFFRALAAVGYTGALSVEFESYRYYAQVLGGDPEAAARLGIETLAAIWDRFGTAEEVGRG
jgi:sugar phosphate isomerase/epimerase